VNAGVIDKVSPGRECGQVRTRIRRTLAGSHGLSISELCRRMKMDERTARAELEYMVREGELDRVRPTGYHRADRDFFAPCSDQRHPWDD
jgi:hypothetical protein